MHHITWALMGALEAIRLPEIEEPTREAAQTLHRIGDLAKALGIAAAATEGHMRRCIKDAAQVRTWARLPEQSAKEPATTPAGEENDR